MGLLTRVLPDQCNTLISQWKRAEQAGLKRLPVFFEMKRACYADRAPFQSLSGRRSFQTRPFATEITGEFKRDLFSDKLAAESSDTGLELRAGDLKLHVA